MSDVFTIGLVLERRGRQYTCRRTEPYTNRKGDEIELFVFEGGCSACGAPFEIKVVPSTKLWNERCPGCIATGRRSA